MTTGKCLSLFFYFFLLDLNQQSVYLHSLCGLLICDGADRRRWRSKGGGGRAKQGERGKGFIPDRERLCFDSYGRY